ncbi:MAG TPA: hypothetical protein VK787_00770 [Puia sp.]|jgi:hypothetical protein|nr:hypothetical protein [Puia sp.]
MIPQEIPNHIKNHVEEIRLRGTYINMAVDVDFILASIIYEIFKQDDLKKIKNVPLLSGRKNKDLDELTLFEKIDVAKYAIETYYKNVYDSKIEDINMLDQLRDYRNQFSHDRIIIAEIEGKKTIAFSKLIANYQTFTTPQYDLKEMWEYLLNYRERIMQILDMLKVLLNIE